MEMKKKEIIEGNRLIAEFLGSKFINDAPEDYPNGYYYQPEEIEGDCPTGIPEDWCFESSWDWLMSVVEKIESLDWGVEITRNSCSIKCGSKPNKFFETYKVCDTKIEAVWLACVGFSDWYNINYK